MTEERIAREIYARLTGVIDPELGKSITDLGMVTGVKSIRWKLDILLFTSILS